MTGMAVLLGLAAVVGFCDPAHAQSQSRSLAPPPGNVAFLTLHAEGTQDYICLPEDGANGRWVFERPEARLFLRAGFLATVDIAEHALLAVPTPTTVADPACSEAATGGQEYCPSWRSSFDESTVWGAKVASETAGSAADCPTTGAIACLLVEAVATTGAKETHSPGLFGAVSFVQRLHTIGGTPPTVACRTGQIEQVPYSADYSFFHHQQARADLP